MPRRRLWLGALALVLVMAVVVAGLLLHENQRLMEVRNEALAELERNVGQYDEQSIVLNNTSKARAEELAGLYGAELRITNNGRFATLTLPEGTTIRDVYAMEESLEYIEEMSADYQVHVSDLEEETEEDGERLPQRPQYSVSDDDYELQTYLDYLNMGTAWSSYKGSNVTVAVIDTGIDTDHPEFAGRISEYSYNATEDKIVKDWLTEDGSYDWSLIEDEQGHGTAVTGVLAASMDGSGIVGIAPNVNIIVIKAECDENGTFLRSSDLVYGIYYAIERDVQVINMSFGGCVNIYAEATQLAYDSDIICVAAAGNSSTSALTYPAADENVIGVGAIDGWELAWYSNFGENTNLVAPGSTYTAKMGGGYATTQGTSLASPIVAGAIALYMQNNQYATFDRVTEILYASCYDLGDLGRDWYYGFGALDISAFLLEDRGTITYDMLTDELENMEGIYIQGHTLQELPEPERLYAVFDGWYYDDTFTQEYNYYEDRFYGDEITLYAKWANEDDGVPYTYVILEDGTVEIRSYTGHRRYITIPEKIEGRTVSSIGDFAFSGQTRLREVTLPSGLTHIGLYAFENCANLVQVKIPANVTEIEAYAFSGNVRLSTVAFLGSSKLETIGDFAFESCGELERIELPASLKSINGSAFYGATALYAIDVQQGNTAYQSKDGVLYNLSGSTLVAFPAAWGTAYTLPEETTTIATYAFAFAGIRQIDLANVTTIGGYGFVNSSLESLVLPDTLTTMGAGAFCYNSNLSQLTVGRGLTTLAERAFAGTSALTAVEIPNNILTLDMAVFSGSGLQTVTFEENSHLTVIGSQAFYDCAISEIDIPDSVLQIGGAAFYYNPLVRVGFGENSSLHTIGGSAFAKCWLLEAIDLPASLRTVGSFAFQNSGLTEVTVPAGVTDLGSGAFAQCSALTAITVEAGNTVYHDLDGVVYTLDNTTIHTYPAGKQDSSYALQDTTQIVAPWAFAGAGNLTSVSLPDSLVQICEYGFVYASGLQSIQIPDNVLQIGRYAFAYDWNLQTVSFRETAKIPRLSYGAFAYCGITSFRVPANVSTMAQRVFEGCTNLTSITFAENSKLESISAYMFDGCTNLQTITFENGSALTSIQAHGLEGMDKLTTINFGDAKVTNVDNFAFRFCESLSTLNLPDTVESIGRYAFYGCKSLSELIIPENVEHIGSYAFLATKDVNLYFASEILPQYLDENWDHGIQGYYTGVVSVTETAEYKYATLTSGDIAILKYLGEATHVDLTAADLGADITIIGGSAFEGSTVQTVVLPETLTAIQAEAFAYSNLTAVSIPAGVTFIGREAFAYTDLAVLTFAENAKIAVIEQYAFQGTKYLTSVSLPASLTTMGTGVFLQSGLESVRFAENIQITEIPQQAFANTRLKEVALPDSVILVNHNAFNNVQTLEKVTFGENDGIRLMSNAFYHTGLTSLHIPANVTYIGEYCFVALTELTEISVDENNSNYKAVDGLLLNKSGRKLIAVPAGRTGSLTVPESVEEIGFGAFEESKVSEILFPENANILTFGYRAFFKAENITTITIPQSVVSIDYYAFGYCENLQEVIFAEDNQLKGIYEGAFIGCINLESITVPDSIVEISDFAFYGCSKIDKLPISETNQIKGIYDYAFAYTGLSGEFTAPESLWDIGNYAFLNCDFTKVTIPDTNKKILIIGIGAFEECNQLEEITLPFIGAGYEDEEVSWFGYIFGAGSYEANETYVPASLKTVTITEGITAIYTGGFAYCTGLETIHVPHSVSVLWTDAFRDTTAKYELTNTVMTYCNYWWGICPYAEEGHFGQGLTGTITLADGVTTIGWSAFGSCTSLESLTIPDSVTSIGDNAFSFCTSLESVTIPDSVTNIGDDAFWCCTSLTGITIPDGVTSIGRGAFWCCTSLESITIPDSVTSIGEWAFYNCASLESITIPDGVTSIGDRAFYCCISLESITIPDSVTSIGEWAFYNCASLESITIPDNITSIGEWAFEGCTSLKKVINKSALELQIGSTDYGYVAYYAYVLEDAEGNITYKDDTYFETEDHFLCSYSNGAYTLHSYLGTEETVTLPGDINGNAYSLYAFSGAKNVIIPDGVTSIDFGAFSGCTGLESITIPDSVTSIGDSAFHGCASLRSVTIGDSVTSIDDSAFWNCTSLESITIPDSVTSIGSSAFFGCTSLKEIILSEDANFILVDGILYDKLVTEIIWVSPAISGDVVILDGVTSIDFGAFSGCTSLESITIPDGVTSIGGHAFENCTSLESITIGDSVTSIGEWAFYWCTSLESITIPDSVTSIGGHAFENCTSLKEIILSENAHYVFSDGILYDNPVTKIIWISPAISSDVVILDGLTGIDPYAFENCTSLESITIPDSVTSIGWDAFGNCTSLKEIILSEDANFSFVDGILYDNLATTIICGLPAISGDVVILDGFTSIGEWAFRDCTSLRSVTIPDSVTSIGEGAFVGCTSLRSVTVPDSVTSIGWCTFYGCTSLESITIPDNITSIGEWAFEGCTSLIEVINKSTLELQIGSSDYGHVAYYAYVLEDAEGKRTYKDDTYFETEDHFLFSYSDGVYTLHSYLGTEETITLPGDINGNTYSIYGFRGARNVIIPDGVTSIGNQAFYYCTSLESITIPASATSIGVQAFWNCTSLESVTIPASVTSIGSDAFWNCTSLESVTIPDSVTSIGSPAFSGCTSLYNNPEYYQNGMLVIDGWLIDVDEDLCYLTNVEQIKGVVGGAYEDCFLLKNAVRGGATLPSNVETLYITSINSNTPCLANLPLTLKNIVICDTVSPSDLYYCQELFTYYNITGVTIYVEALEIDLRWDDNFPGWSNGNKVVYGDEWHWVNFYDENGKQIYIEPCRNSQIIRLPVHEIASDERYTYEIIGWDMDGDGEVDSIPATSVVDINAKPVVVATERLYSVQFVDRTSGAVYCEMALPYGAEIPTPENPSKQGHDFVSWVGLYDGLTVSGDMVVYASWQHHGNGHEYADPVWVDATCTEPGYYKHECTICGEFYGTEYSEALGHDYEAETVAPGCITNGYTLHTCTRCGDSYRDQFTPATGHSYGDWVVDQEAKCEEQGAKHRNCTICGDREDAVIAALGHQFATAECTEATCTTTGVQTYCCTDCGMTITEEIPTKAHTYEKQYASTSFLEELISLQMDILWGYEGDSAYYYECADCGCIMTTAEAESYGVGTASTVCRHKTTVWEIAREPDCVGVGVERYVCADCGKTLEARTYGTMTAHSYGEWYTVTEPTCTEEGVSRHDCINCEHYETAAIDPNGHTLVHHEAKAPTCTEIGWAAYDTCEHCDYSTYVEIEANGHTLVHHEAKAPACTEIGWDAYDTCDHCDYSTYAEIEANGHSLVHHEAKAPTCTEIGWSAYDTCECCDYSTYVEIEANGHSLVHHEAKAPTCTEIGWNAYDTCEHCDYTTYVEIEANGHTLVHHEAKAPTCTEIGWAAYDTCEHCDYTTYVEISANGHTLVHHEAKAPTCTEIGWAAYDTCEHCDYSTYVEIEANGHTLVHHEAKAPTCTEIGWDAYDTCDHCDYSTYAEIEANGHSLVHHEAKAPTCTEIGWSAYDTCECCDYTTYVEIEANGHTLVHHEAKVPTCTEIGWNAYDTCECCDYSTYVEIEANGHSLVHHEAKAPTCTEIGWSAYDTCEHCDYSTYVEIEANGHTLVHHDAKAPTCTEIGWNAYDTCECCDYSTYVEIEANGHSHEAVVTAPTCTEQGYTTYTCHCGDSYVDDYTDAHGHSYVGGSCEHCGQAAPAETGDANGDGEIDFLDAMLVLQYYVGDIGEDSLNTAAADANGDGEIDFLDAMLILQYYVGDIDTFPAAALKKPVATVKKQLKRQVVRPAARCTVKLY